MDILKRLIKKYRVVGNHYIIPVVPHELKYPSNLKEKKYLSIINKLLEITRQDPMTGLMHKEYYQQQRQPERTQIGLRDVYIMIDGDGLKKLNDEFGHEAGHAAILSIADGIKAAIRPSDSTVTRLGGDEFLVHVQNASLATGVAIAKRILESIKKQKITTHYKGDVKTKANLEGKTILASLGVGYSEANADKALYKAKEKGRGRVEFYVSQDDVVPLN